MKNTLKKGLSSAIAFLMAFVMIFGTTPAFATEVGDTVKWYVDSDTDYEEYRIDGKFDSSDELSIAAETGYRTYAYILNIENTGYYAVTQIGYPFVHYAKTFENGIAKGEYDYCDILSCSDSSEYPDAEIIYLEAGENFITVSAYDMMAVKVSYDFLGETITKVGYDQECLENLIIGCEVSEDSESFQLEHFSYIDLTFSSGKTVNNIMGNDVIVLDAPVREGENTGYMEIINHKEPITFTAYPTEKYVESMEITNIEEVLDVKKDYRGEYIFHNVCDETVTVKFTDGSKLEIQQSEDINIGMDFINGHHYNLITHYDETYNGMTFKLGFTKHMFSEGSPILFSAPCKVSDLSFSENLEILSEIILREYLRVFADIDLGSILDLDLKELYYAHMDSMGHIKEFFDYYF